MTLIKLVKALYMHFCYLIIPESASFTEAIASGIPAGFFPPA